MNENMKNNSIASLHFIENIGLVIIAIATVVAASHEVVNMWVAGTVTLSDLLLLFIYLEVFAMIGIYLESHRLPVRMPIYIAIVALARYLILDMKEMDAKVMLAVAVTILLLAITVLIHRYGHVSFPYLDKSKK